MWWPNPFRRRPSETKTLSEPELLEIFGIGGITSAGITVTAESALRVPAVACAVRIISEAVAALPAQPGLDSWNAWTTPFEGLRQLVCDALTHDHGGLAWVNRVDGKVVEIIRFTPPKITVEYADTGEPTYKIRDRVLNPADVIHLRNPFDRCPVTLAREAIGLCLIMEGHGARLFGNGARPSGVLSVKGATNPDTIAKIRTAWQAAHGGGKSGGTAIVGSEASYQQLTLTSVDAQFLELRQFQLAEISRAFRVPLPMLSDLSRATWSNGQQQGREFLVYCLEPVLLGVEGAFQRVGISLKFDRDDLTRADIGERSEAYSKLIASRVLNPNEARHWEGMPPYDGGDQFLNPNVVAAGAPNAAA